MKVINTKPWTAKVSVGLQKGYSNERWTEAEFQDKLSVCQHRVKEMHGTLLSAAVTFGCIVFLGQKEPTAFLSFIQYPRLIQNETDLEKGVLRLAELLALAMEQNRIVIEFSDETVMLEQSNDLDPKIDLK